MFVFFSSVIKDVWFTLTASRPGRFFSELVHSLENLDGPQCSLISLEKEKRKKNLENCL